MQGALRKERLSIRIESECAHCSRPIEIDVDNQLNWETADPSAAPLIFEPSLDWEHFSSPNIIHDY